VSKPKQSQPGKKLRAERNSLTLYMKLLIPSPRSQLTDQKYAMRFVLKQLLNFRVHFHLREMMKKSV